MMFGRQMFESQTRNDQKLEPNPTTHRTSSGNICWKLWWISVSSNETSVDRFHADACRDSIRFLNQLYVEDLDTFAEITYIH